MIYAKLNSMKYSFIQNFVSFLKVCGLANVFLFCGRIIGYTGYTTVASFPNQCIVIFCVQNFGLFERHQARLFPGSSATEGRQGNMLPLYFIAFAWEVSFLSYSLFIDRSMLRILKRDTCRKDSRTFPVDCLNLSIFFSSQRCIMAVKTIDIEGKWVVKCSHWKDLRK